MTQNLMRLDEPLGKRYEQENELSNAEYFIAVAHKIGFDDHEIARMTMRYRSRLEEAKE